MAKKKRAPKPRRKPRVFLWTAQRIEAAQLLAEDDFTDAEIAAKVGIAVRQIYEWKARPEFAARVEQIVKKLGAISERRVIARRNRRLLALEDRWLRMQRVIDARAALLSVPVEEGGDSGLLVRQQRMLGSGDNATLIEEYAVDTALLREMRETEKQAAQECGQWVEKHAPTDPTGFKEFSGGLTDEERASALARIMARVGQASGGQPGDGEAAGQTVG